MNPKIVNPLVLASTSLIFGAGTLCLMGVYELRIARLNGQLANAKKTKEFWLNRFRDLALTLPPDDLVKLAESIELEADFLKIVHNL